MNKEKIIDRVKKLFSLAENNPSQEEAISAALKAQKLMAQYNIHEDDLLEEIKDDISSIMSSQKVTGHTRTWRFQLALTVGTAFRCKVYKQGQQVVFRGYKSDAEIALQVYLSLYEIGNKLAHHEKKKIKEELGTGAGAYNSFVLGFLYGIRDSLNKQCTALLIVTPKEVEEDWEEFQKANFMEKARTQNYSVTNSSLYSKGYNAGKDAVESNRIEEKTYA